MGQDEHGQPPPRLADETRWYTEHAALLISTLKWAFLGAAAGLCVGFGTRAFLWALAASGTWVKRATPGGVAPMWFLPLALPACVFLIRAFAPTARGHGTEAVIAAIHRDSGRIPWKVAPVKLIATVATLAFGGSVGKEGPCAQIGAAITSLFADILGLGDADRRRLVICGVGAGFAAVFGTPISGALFGIEVLYLGRIEYAVLFPCLVSGIVAHLVCGSRAPVPALPEGLGGLGRSELVGLSIVVGALFGLVALLLIESMRGLERGLRRFEKHPYLVASVGGVFLAAFYALVGDQYAGLGVPTIEAALAATGKVALLAFLWKIVSTVVTLGTGGSGGIVTPLFFIGATSGAAFARLFHLPVGLFSAFGFVSVVAGAANTPIAAAVMGIELLPRDVGVYAALAAGTAFLLVGHRSVYPSQKIGLSKSAGLDVQMGGAVGDLRRSGLTVREGSLTEKVTRLVRRRSARKPK
ncbi:MAG TPA: chloride channel protein [Thermoanaerobaculia bacterium]|nr:chloride channel protein [Thermoanaerobaculia bacterium]